MTGARSSLGKVLKLLPPLAILCTGCVSTPDAPDAPNLEPLATEYDAPTAAIPGALVAEVVESSSVSGLLTPLSGFAVLEQAIEEASAALEDSGGSSNQVEVSGSVRARSACPGHRGTTPTRTRAGSVTPDDVAAPAIPEEPTSARAAQELYGWVDVTLGVDDSELQRTFTGAVQSCEFSAAGALATEDVTLSMAFDADFGSDVPLGEALPKTLLVSARDVRLLAVGSGKVTSLPSFDFRRTSSGAIEVLFDAAQFRPTLQGSVVVIQNADGSRGLRTRDGEWLCRIGGGACVRRS